MAGLITNGLPQLAQPSGSELMYFDTNLSQGAAPQDAMSSLAEAAIMFRQFGASADKTTVAGSRYYRSILIGSPKVLTGVDVLVGGTGGTDSWLVELHDSTGALVATSTTSGVTAGTANTWQQFAFTATYSAAPGTYYIVVQSNGTTAKLAALDSPVSPLVTGSATGSFGTGASITPPTTYTVNLGPMALPY